MKRDHLVIFRRPGARWDRISARVEIGAGDQAEPVITIGFPSDREMTRAGCAKRRGACSQPCPAPRSLLVL